jgi:hypothetical protein
MLLLPPEINLTLLWLLVTLCEVAFVRVAKYCKQKMQLVSDHLRRNDRLTTLLQQDKYFKF